MQAKISKTLEAIIARTAFETSKRAITHSLKDFLTLEILREEGSLAHQILTSRLKDWEIHQICLRIESEIRSVSAPDSSRQNPEEFFPLYTRELQRLFAPMHHVSTAHALLHIAGAGHVPFRCTGDSDRTAKDDPGGRSNDASGYQFSADTRTTVHRPARTCPGHSSCGTCLVGQIRHRPYVRSSQRPHRSRRRTRAGDGTHRADPLAPQEEQPDPDRRSRRGQERHRRRAGPADGSGRSSRHHPRQTALFARRIVAPGRDQIQR